MKKSATAYRRNDSWYLHSESQTTDGVWIASQPFRKFPADVSLSDIGEAVISVLEASCQGVPHPANWNAVEYPLPEMAGVKSWATFMRTASNVDLDVTDGLLTISANKNCGPIEGFEPIAGKEVRLLLNSAPEEVGRALQAAIALCE